MDRVFMFVAPLMCVASALRNGTVYIKGDAFTFEPGKSDPSGVAYGSFATMTESQTGFGQLTVQVNKGGSYNDSALMYAAGFLEGALTAPQIWLQWQNLDAWILTQFKNGIMPPSIPAFFASQDAWSRAQVANNKSSALWQLTGLIISQFDGLRAGYSAVAPASEPMTEFAFQQLSANADLMDLIPALDPGSSAHPSWDELQTAEELMARVRATTHCSGLVKVTGNYSDLFWGHSTWFIYQGTSRIFKSYDFSGVRNSAAVGRRMSFSSYPGYLSSLDDFVNVWDTGLAMIETSNSIFNMTLYKAVVPQSLWAWQRVRLASMAAADPPAWSDWFSQYNSGTYNNAYGVVNVGAFAPNEPLKPDTMWLVEQIPGLVVGGDVTPILEMGYFPMYNVPFWPVIYNTSGYPDTLARYGLDKRNARLGSSPLAGIDYQMAPRAQIFRRDAATARDLDSFIDILRYNKYKTDPYSQGSPWNAICSRGDLAGQPDGCYDTKASAASLWKQQASWAINGPTTQDGSLPPFTWAGAFSSYPHAGLPETYNFTLGEVTPAWL